MIIKSVQLSQKTFEGISKIKFGKVGWDADWVGFSRKLKGKCNYL